MLRNDSYDFDQSFEEVDGDDLRLRRVVLQAVWGVARDRRSVKNMDDLYNRVLGDYDIRENELRALWRAANNPLIARDVDEFCNIFANGMIAGAEYVLTHELANRESLFLSARAAEFNRFAQLFAQGYVNVNATFEGQTFLHALINSDNCHDIINPKITQGLAQIADLVLQNNASIDIPGRVGKEENVTVRQLLHRWENTNANTFSNNLWYSLFAYKPTQGDGVMPVVKGHLEQRNQAALQQQAMQQTNNDAEAERPSKHQRVSM